MTRGKETSLTGFLVSHPPLNRPWLRRGLAAAAIGVCGVLALFPQPYRAAMSLTPNNPASLGIGTLGQLGALGSVFGDQSAVEVSVRVAESPYARSRVSNDLQLPKRLHMSEVACERWLKKKVHVRTVRGGILVLEMKTTDPKLGKEIIADYGEALRAQLAAISRAQTANKRQILADLVTEASEKLATAQAAYDTFRLQTRYSNPQAAIAAIGDRIPQLEAAIRAKQVELNAERQFATDDNITVRQTLAEIEALQKQLSQARSISTVDPSSVGRVVKESTEADKLRRALDLAQGLYDSYKLYMQGTAVEDLTSSVNIRVLEPPYIDPSRQYNLLPLSVGVLLLLLTAAMEFYLIRPPLEYAGEE